jgi:hypothetical protein
MLVFFASLQPISAQKMSHSELRKKRQQEEEMNEKEENPDATEKEKRSDKRA